jgi:hypothetical protein
LSAAVTLTRNEVFLKIRAIVKDVRYPGWNFLLHDGDRFHVQGRFLAEDIATGQIREHYTRKWYISAEATKNEIVQTCLKCVLTALEHEARERFTYKGEAIYGPHFDPDQLAALCKKPESLEARS